MNNPLFSVVIPTYNRSEKLIRALESLNQQTFKNFEVLVCDDGSTDNTGKAIDGFREKISFNALRYFFEPNWGGPARPRNIGISNATAEWICLLDSDDTWHPEKLEHLLPFLNDYDACYHNFELIYNANKKSSTNSRSLKAPVFDDLMLNGHNGCIINSGFAFRKSLGIAIGGQSEDKKLIGVEDADFVLRLACVTNRFRYIPKQLGTYYLDGENITVYNRSMVNKLNYLFSIHVENLESPRVRKLAENTNLYNTGRIFQRMKEYKTAIRCYRSGLRSPNRSFRIRSLAWILYCSLLQLKPGALRSQ